MCDTTFCELSSTGGIRERSRGNSLVVTVLVSGFKLVSNDGTAEKERQFCHPRAAREPDTHKPLSLAAFFTWCTILLPTRKGTSFTELGWIAVGIDYNPAQFCLIEAHNNPQALHYILTTGICSVTVALVLFGEPFPVSGFPAPT